MNSGTSSGWYSLLWASHFPLTVLCHTGHSVLIQTSIWRFFVVEALLGYLGRLSCPKEFSQTNWKTCDYPFWLNCVTPKGAAQPALPQRLHSRNPTQSSWQQRSPGKQFPQNSPIRPLRTVESRTQPAEYSSPLTQSHNHRFTLLRIYKYNFAIVMNYMQDIWFATPKEIATNRRREPLP